MDVCGHGLGSAMHAASALNVIRGRTLGNTDFGDPTEVLGALNRAFQMDDHNGMFFTIWYGVLDPGKRTLRYASAGHPPAIVCGPGGEIRERLVVKNPPIGAVAGRTFGEARVELDAGDRVYVFSDGAFEVTDAEGRVGTLDDFERELSAQAADRTPGEPARLYDAVLAAAGADVLEDDFTVLLVNVAAAAAS